MNFNMSEFKKAIVVLIIFSIALLLITMLIVNVKSDTSISDINEFIKNETKVLYITNNSQYNKEILKLFEKYEIEYKYINSSKLDKLNRINIQKIVEEDNLDNLIVVYNNGKIESKLLNSNKNSEILKFLKNYDIIPNRIGNTDIIMEEVTSSLESEYLILYITYKETKNIQKQSSILEKISEKYEIEYRHIEAYLLSENQKQKINQQIGISEVEEQIVVLIKDKELISTIREEYNYDEYLKKLKEISFIKTKSNIEKIDIDKFKKIIKSDSQSIIIIVKEDCYDCDKVIETLKEMNVETINYLNVKNIEHPLYLEVQSELKNMGFTDGFALPTVIITQNNKLLDYIVGTTKKEYFVDIFKENGIIK